MASAIMQSLHQKQKRCTYFENLQWLRRVVYILHGDFIEKCKLAPLKTTLVQVHRSTRRAHRWSSCSRGCGCQRRHGRSRHRPGSALRLIAPRGTTVPNSALSRFHPQPNHHPSELFDSLPVSKYYGISRLS